MKILINTPDINNLGGVANHYKGLKEYWNTEVNYHFIAGRNNIPGFILLPYDLLSFFYKLMFGSYDLVVLNPSLGSTALRRDAVFLYIASFFKVKKVVFFHGWNKDLSKKIEIDSSWFTKKYDKADAFFVLAKEFKKSLRGWGITKPIFLTTTKVDNRLIEDKPLRTNNQRTILFLARVEEYKGVFIALDVFHKLKDEFPDLKLVIAGGGSALSSCRSMVQSAGMNDVEFLGPINSTKVSEAFVNSDLYLLPTYGEGMPTSLLEAMAFGLPVVTTPVGGIPDFFDTKNMGSLVNSKDPSDFVDVISALLKSPDKMKKIAVFNKDYAKENFMASRVALNIENLLKKV
ncbi:glycosyltransferase family 4 protein [Vibrio natriegens]|uniref:glycosyltransferase family 4 protein n=1 Tax=Vibrio natriegens TaxID=691 RepID=UPI003558E02B